MKRTLSILLVMALSVIPLAGCGNSAAPAESSAAPESVSESKSEAPAEAPAEEPKEEAPSDSGEKPYIAVVSKGFQHQFWQTVYAGSKDAAEKYNIEMTFEGPPSESDIGTQVDMVNAALAKNPKALCLAALDTQSLNAQLEQAKGSGIPVVGFDSGVPDAPAGSVVSTASTNNYNAGELAAEEMFNEASFAERLKAATAGAPVSIAVQSQDATSASILDRTNGFINKMLELIETVHPGGAEVTGHDVFKKAAGGDVVVSIKVTVPPTTSYTDAQAACQTMLQNNSDLIGYFVSNEASVTGILAATNDGTDLNRDTGIYKDLIVVGFDAGKPQKDAVASQYFYGSVTQDPYMIGYLAVELAYKSINGEAVDEVADTGCKFYTHQNMNEADIAQLLYD